MPNYPVITIDRYSIHYCEAGCSGESMWVDKTRRLEFSEPLIHGEMGSQSWADRRLLKNILKDILPSKLPLLPRKVAVIFADSQVKTLFTTLDKINLTVANTPSGMDFIKFRLQKVLQGEVSQPHLFDFQPVCISGEPLSEEGDKSEDAPLGSGSASVVECQIDFIIHAIQEAFLNELKESLENLGWILISAAPASTTLFNLLAPPQAGKLPDHSSHLEDCILIDSGLEVTTISFFQKNILRYLRVIEVAGHHIEKELATLDEITISAARDRLFSEPLLPETHEQYIESFSKMGRITRIFGNWFRELSLTLQFYGEKNPSFQINSICLTGSLSQIPHIESVLGKLLSYEVKKLNPKGLKIRTDLPANRQWEVLPALGKVAGLIQ